MHPVNPIYTLDKIIILILSYFDRGWTKTENNLYEKYKSMQIKTTVCYISSAQMNTRYYYCYI